MSGEPRDRVGRHSAELVADARDGAPPVAAAVAPGSTARRYRTTALIIACALFMQNLDATVLATALPTMARDFAVPPQGMSLALTSYLLALAVFIPASGPVADRYGARPVFQAAIATFVAGSIACGFAGGLTALVAARFVQGIGGAMMVPVGRLVLLRSVEKRDLVPAMAWLTMPAMIGPILGPPLGGLMVTYLDWRWIFWINVPMGILGMVLVGRFITDVRQRDWVAFDAVGFALSAIGLAPTLFGLQLASRSGHGRIAAALVAFGVVSLAGYVVHARRHRHPILDLSLLAIPTFGLSVAGGTLVRITQGAQPFLLPMMMQLAFGLNAAQSGGVTVATALGAFAMKGAVRSILRRAGFRACLLAVGVAAPAVFAVIGLFRPGWPWPAMIAVLFAYGFLTSLQFTAFNAIAYDEVPPARLSAATSFYATAQQLALSIGVCVGAATLGAAMRIRGHASPSFDDFSVAIWSVVAISLTVVLVNRRLSPSAGAELAGRDGR